MRAGTPRNTSEILNDIQTSALQLLEQKGHSNEDCKAFWAHLSEDYFLRHTDSEIAWQTSIVLNTEDITKTQVHIHHLIRRGCSEIFIYSMDKELLFANITSCLHQLNLSILDARIITSNHGHALNTFTVVDKDEQAITDKNTCKQIEEKIINALDTETLEENSASQFISSRLRHFHSEPIVTIKNARHLDHTSLHIHATDHPGLLADVAQAFALHEAIMISARVSTLGEKVHDIFYITNKHGQKILDEDEQQALINSILEKISASPDNISTSINF